MTNSVIALPYPRYKIEEGAVKADGLISISPSDTSFYEAPIPKENFGEILALRFDDIPAIHLWDTGRTLKGPTIESLETALAFAKRTLGRNSQAKIAVNCLAGKSRSAAIALAVNATAAKEAWGNGHEAQTVAELLTHDPDQQMCFNPKIIDDADRLLDNQRGLHNALHKLCAPYRSWREYWERQIP